jgi:hypothetical protein
MRRKWREIKCQIYPIDILCCQVLFTYVVVRFENLNFAAVSCWGSMSSSRRLQHRPTAQLWTASRVKYPQGETLPRFSELLGCKQKQVFAWHSKTTTTTGVINNNKMMKTKQMRFFLDSSIRQRSGFPHQNPDLLCVMLMNCYQKRCYRVKEYNQLASRRQPIPEKSKIIR